MCESSWEVKKGYFCLFHGRALYFEYLMISSWLVSSFHFLSNFSSMPWTMVNVCDVYTSQYHTIPRYKLLNKSIREKNSIISNFFFLFSVVLGSQFNSTVMKVNCGSIKMRIRSFIWFIGYEREKEGWEMKNSYNRRNVTQLEFQFSISIISSFLKYMRWYLLCMMEFFFNFLRYLVKGTISFILN